MFCFNCLGMCSHLFACLHFYLHVRTCLCLFAFVHVVFACFFSISRMLFHYCWKYFGLKPLKSTVPFFLYSDVEGALSSIVEGGECGDVRSIKCSVLSVEWKLWPAECGE